MKINHGKAFVCGWLKKIYIKDGHTINGYEGFTMHPMWLDFGTQLISHVTLCI